MLKKISFLTIAAGLTVVATFVQQFTSSDRPYNTSININKNDYDFKLPIVHEGNEECLLELNIPDTSIRGKIFFRRLNFNEDWKVNRLIRYDEKLLGVLSPQQPNLKLQYYIELESGANVYSIAKLNPVIVRFQGAVPKYILFPHVALMFVALIFSCFAGILSLFNAESYKKYSNVTFYLFAIGIIIFGFLVHIISYRHLILNPLGHNDLTFYKNLVIFLLWLGVYQLNKKFNIRYLVFLVSLLTLVLYCLPQQLIISWLH